MVKLSVRSALPGRPSARPANHRGLRSSAVPALKWAVRPQAAASVPLAVLGRRCAALCSSTASSLKRRSKSSSNQARERIWSAKRSLFSNSTRGFAAAAIANTNTNASSLSVVGAGALVREAAKRATIGARSALSHARPNLSIERTSSSKLRLLPAAAHVER